MKTMKRVLAVCAVGFGAMVCEAETTAKSPPFRLETRESFGGRLACGVTPVAATADGVTTGSVTVAGGGAAAPLWDTAAQPDGWYDLTLAGVTNGATARIAILNGPGVRVREGTLTNDATWASDAVQVVRHWVVVPAGRTLTLDGAVVKFCDGTGIRVDAGGTLNAVGAILTHVADDTAGGDTNMDGEQTAPAADRWEISGTGTVNLDAATEERWRTQAVTSGTISSSQTWRGSRVYLVSGDITVASGATLTVQPGAVVKFAAGVSLIVNSGGTLNAVGNRAQPIVFTSYRDDTVGGDTNGDGASSEAQPGDWVKLGVNGGVARMEYVSILYSSKNSTTGAINMNGGSVTFVNGVIAHGMYDAVGVESGNYHMTNSVIRDCLLAFRHWPRDPIVNCVVSDCGRITQGGGQNFVNCSFVNITDVYEAFGWSSTYRYCHFFNPSGFGPQSAQPVGSNGNIWGDPLFTDAANGDYTLLADSPLIDAGDGAAAPETDYYGQPRMDVRGVADTGVAATNGICPDIGIYEYPGFGGGASPDLAVVAVSATNAISVGETLTVLWSVANVRGLSAGGSWRDAVSLVSEDGLSSVELGTSVSSATLAPGATNSFSASFLVPPNAEGVWRVRVQVNAYRDIYEGTLTSNNVLTAAATTTVSVSASDPVAGFAGLVQSGKPYATSVTFDGTNSMVGRIQASAGTVVYYGIGFMPTAGAYSGRAVCDGGGGVIGIPATDQRIYLLVVSESASAQPFTVTFESGETVVRSVSPSTIPHTGRTSLTLAGANFAEGCALSFVGGGKTVAVSNVVVASSETLRAEVDCAAFAAGQSYGVRVTSGTNVAELADALTVQAAPGKAELACSLTVPDSVREGRTFLLYVNYENTGNLDMPAPVFTVKANGVNFTVDGHTYSNSVKVMGLSAAAPVGTLRPHEPQRLAVQAQARPGTRSVSYTLLKDYAGSAGSKAKLPLALFFSEDWIYEHDAADDALIAALQARIGATWEAFYGNLGAYATGMQQYTGAAVTDYEVLRRMLASSAYQSVKAEMAAQEAGAQSHAASAPPHAMAVPSQSSASTASSCTEPDRLEVLANVNFETVWSQRELRTRTERHRVALSQDSSRPGDIWVYHADCGWWHRLVGEGGGLRALPHARTVLICHGNLHSVHSSWVLQMAEALAANDAVNVLAVDWGDDATESDIRALLSPPFKAEPEFAKATAVDIPEVARKAYGQLRQASVAGGDLTLIGHSHGGHVAGCIAGHYGQVRRLVGLETSNYDSHSLVPAGNKFPNRWNANSALQTEFYKTSYWMSMGSDIRMPVAVNKDARYVYADFNFYVVNEFDSFSYYDSIIGLDPESSTWWPEGRLPATRHDFSPTWFMATIRNRDAKLGYWWNYDGWTSLSRQPLAPSEKYHGIISGASGTDAGKIELKRPGSVSAEDWRYDAVMFQEKNTIPWKCPHDQLQENSTHAIDYQVRSVGFSGEVLKTGQDVAISMQTVNAADNISVEYEFVNLVSSVPGNDSWGPWRPSWGWSLNKQLGGSVWLCGMAEGEGEGESLPSIASLRGRAWTKVSDWKIDSLEEFIRPATERFKNRQIQIPPKIGGVQLSGRTNVWLIVADGIAMNGDNKPDDYDGDLCPTNNYFIQKVIIDPGSNCVARIAVNGTSVSDGERSAVAYVAAKGTSASVALSGGGSEKGSSEIKTYRWSVSDGTMGSPAGVTSSLSVPLPVGTDQKTVAVTLTIMDMNGLTDVSEVIVPVRRDPEEPDGETGDQDRSTVPQSCDPNEVAGPLGFGDPDTQRYVQPGQWLEYTVYFENRSNATASAQEVVVTNPLSEYLDWSTFEMGEVAFNNQLDLGLYGLRSGQSEAALDGTNFSVRTELAVDQATGVASWYLRIVDPATVDSWPSDPHAGFLPPNDDTHRGEGHLSYRVKVREDAVGSAVISNAATIVFDYNAPITTDPSWWNTVALPSAVVFEGAEGTTNITLTVGLPYGDLPAPARAGYTFGGWWTGPAGTGTRVTADMLVPEGDVTLFAQWIPIPILTPPIPILTPPSGDSDALSSPGSFDGFFYGEGDFNGGAATAVRGTLNVKVSDAVAGKLTAKAVLQKGSLSFSAKAWTGTESDGTRRVTLPGKGGETLDLYLRQDRVWGSLSGGSVGGRLELDGARNRFAEKGDAAAQALLNRYLGYYTVALPACDALSLGSASAAPQGVGYLAVTVGKGGSAKIAGVLADGTKVKQSSRLVLFGEDAACVPFFAPLYAKQGWAGGLLWVAPDRGAVATDRDLGWFVRWENPGKGPDGFRELLDACGGYYSGTPSLAAHYLFVADAGEALFNHAGGAEKPAAVPDGVAVTAAGMRMTMVKGAKPAKVSGDGGVWYEYDESNPASATLAFAARTGLLKGKFSLYYDYELNGAPQHKAVSVPYAGVLVPVRGAAFGALPAGLGHCLVPEGDPALKAYKLKRSYPVWLEAK